MSAPARLEPGPWTVEQFDAFYRARPPSERWQLVAGMPVMMTPPTLVHQRIAMNVAMLLNLALPGVRPDLFALTQTGIRNPLMRDAAPEPDVAVVPGQVGAGHWADNVFLACEIVSPSNRRELIAAKQIVYERHPDNLVVLVVEQSRVAVQVSRRDDAWERRVISGLDTRLLLPEFGVDCALLEIYRGTPLALA